MEKTVSYKVQFDFSGAEKQAEAMAKRQNAKLGKAATGGARPEPYAVKGERPGAQQIYPTARQPSSGIMQNIMYFMRRIAGHNSQLSEIFRIGEHLTGGGRNIGRSFGGRIAGGFSGGGRGGFISAAAGGAEGGIPFARLAGSAIAGEGAGAAGGLAGLGGLAAAAGPIGLAVAGAALVVTTAFTAVTDALKGFGEGISKITKSIVTGNTSSAMHGALDIGQSMIGGKSGLLTNFILRGPAGVIVGYLIGNVLGGVVHKLIDGLDGIVNALGKYSPIVNAQLAMLQVKQFMFSYQMAQIFQPLMSAWIKLKSFVLDMLSAFGQVLRPLITTAGNMLSDFVDTLKYTIIGLLDILSSFIQDMKPIVAFFPFTGKIIDLMDTYVNALNKTVGILSKTNSDMNVAAQNFIKSFVTGLTSFKGPPIENRWKPAANPIGYRGPMHLVYVPPNAQQQAIAPNLQPDDNSDKLADYLAVRKKEHPNAPDTINMNLHGRGNPANAPAYVPGPSFYVKNSLQNSFNLKVSLDEMVENAIAEIRKALTNCKEQNAAESTLAGMLVTGAVKGLLM